MQAFALHYPGSISYLENQWSEDTYKSFEKEHGDEGEEPQNLGSMLLHLARWCDANGVQLSEAWKIAATRYRRDEGRGRQFSVKLQAKQLSAQ
jgi:hypothetical protein